MSKYYTKGTAMCPTVEQPIQIGELAKELKITTRTLRYYEEIGLMGKAKRSGTGTRTYSRENILRLKFILKLKELGIPLKEMQEIAKHFDITPQSLRAITPQLLEILDDHLSKVDQKIARLASLRKEIVNYRSRISDVLQGNYPGAQ